MAACPEAPPTRSCPSSYQQLTEPPKAARCRGSDSEKAGTVATCRRVCRAEERTRRQGDPSFAIPFGTVPLGSAESPQRFGWSERSSIHSSDPRLLLPKPFRRYSPGKSPTLQHWEG